MRPILLLSHSSSRSSVSWDLSVDRLGGKPNMQEQELADQIPAPSWTVVADPGATNYDDDNNDDDDKSDR